MKKQIVLCLLALSLGISACQQVGVGSNKENSTENAATTAVSAAEFEQKMATYPDVQLIDVRTPKEYEKGHLLTAMNIDIEGDDFDKQAAVLDKSKPVFVYCKSGRRSENASERMQGMGFKVVYSLDGGIVAWEAAGKAVEEKVAVDGKGALTQADINKYATQKKYVLIDYNAVWCGPCKKMAPILEQLAGKRRDSLLLVKVDADENKALLQQKEITGIPYLELYKDGKLVWTYTGMISEEGLVADAGL